MKMSEHIERINKMHHLISSGNTGTPAQFAQKLKISESRLYGIVDDLKSEKVPIEYSRRLGTYYYSKPFKMQASLQLQELDEDELKNISGGFVYSNFLVVDKCSFVPSMAVAAGNDTNLLKKELVLF